MRHMYPIILIALVGCSPAVPPPGEYLPAISIALGVAADAAPTPPGPPAPKPNDVCPNCGGTGTLGDGRTVIDCPPPCENGRLVAATPSAIQIKQPRSGSPAPASASAPPAAVPPTPAAGAPTTPRTAIPARTTVRTRVTYQCGPDGVCRPVRTYERVR